MCGIAHSAVFSDQLTYTAYAHRACECKEDFLVSDNIVALVHYELFTENVGTVFDGRHCRVNKIGKSHCAFTVREKTYDMYLLRGAKLHSWDDSQPDFLSDLYRRTAVFTGVVVRQSDYVKSQEL